jgi:hypothetical protein
LRSNGRVRWALSALCHPHLTPALSAPKGREGADLPSLPLGRIIRGESSVRGERGDVARPVQHADDDHRIRKRPIVDCVGAMKRYAQSGSEPIAPRCREREAPHRVERGLDLPDEPGRNLLR